jgi:probable rRNA maturation factor
MVKQKISFFNEGTSYRLKQKKLLRNWIIFSIKNENKQPGEINVILCPDDYLYKMNVEYLQHDTLTDIITFDYGEADVVSGDLFISLDRIKENAAKYAIKTADELHRVIIHGILHLCGYNDKNGKEKIEMTAREDSYLSLRPDELRS